VAKIEAIPRDEDLIPMSKAVDIYRQRTTDGTRATMRKRLTTDPKLMRLLAFRKTRGRWYCPKGRMLALFGPLNPAGHDWNYL
jgi:hypothetical protein